MLSRNHLAVIIEEDFGDVDTLVEDAMEDVITPGACASCGQVYPDVDPYEDKEHCFECDLAEVKGIYFIAGV